MNEISFHFLKFHMNKAVFIIHTRLEQKHNGEECERKQQSQIV